MCKLYPNNLRYGINRKLVSAKANMGMCLSKKTPPSPYIASDTDSTISVEVSTYISDMKSSLHDFNALYKKSTIVNKWIFLNSGFIEDDYCPQAVYPESSCLSRQTPTTSAISATYSYGGTDNSSSVMARSHYVNMDLLKAPCVPALVYDVSKKSKEQPCIDSQIISSTPKSGTDERVKRKSKQSKWKFWNRKDDSMKINRVSLEELNSSLSPIRLSSQKSVFFVGFL